MYVANDFHFCRSLRRQQGAESDLAGRRTRCGFAYAVCFRYTGSEPEPVGQGGSFMASADYINTASAYQPRPGDIVSRCGLLCNTCSAYIAGACPGCPSLETGECVIRDCAELKGTSCLDCQADSCYHFEAYVWRRKTMNAVAKRFFRLTRQGAAEAARAAAAEAAAADAARGAAARAAAAAAASRPAAGPRPGGRKRSGRRSPGVVGLRIRAEHFHVRAAARPRVQRLRHPRVQRVP